MLNSDESGPFPQQSCVHRACPLEKRKTGDTTMTIRNLTRYGLPLGAVAALLVTAIGASITWGSYGARLAAVETTAEETQKDIKQLRREAEDRHVELLKALYDRSPGSSPAGQ